MAKNTSHKPTRKTAPKQDDPEQSKRFIEMGKELGADKDKKALERGLKKLIPVKVPNAR